MEKQSRSRRFDSLRSQLEDLSKAIAEEEERYDASIAAALPGHRASAVDLTDYLGLRKQDVHTLQLELAALGLSSLGHCEANLAIRCCGSIPGSRPATGRRGTRKPETSSTGPPPSVCCMRIPRRCSARVRGSATSTSWSRHRMPSRSPTGGPTRCCAPARTCCASMAPTSHQLSGRRSRRPSKLAPPSWESRAECSSISPVPRCALTSVSSRTPSCGGRAARIGRDGRSRPHACCWSGSAAAPIRSPSRPNGSLPCGSEIRSF